MCALNLFWNTLHVTHLMLLLFHMSRYLLYMSATFLSFLKAKTTTRNSAFFMFLCVLCFFWQYLSFSLLCRLGIGKIHKERRLVCIKNMSFHLYIVVLFYILGPVWLCLHCFYVFSFSINLLAHCGWKTHQTLFCANNSGLEISPCSFRYFSTVHLQ